MIIAKGFEFVKESRYSRNEKCPFQQEVPTFRALHAVRVQGDGAREGTGLVVVEREGKPILPCR